MGAIYRLTGSGLAFSGKQVIEKIVFTPGDCYSTLYVYDEIDRTNVKKIPPNTDGAICFVIKDNEEILFFMKNSESGKENISAMWTNSSAMIYSKKLLFDLLWSKSKSIPI